MQLMNKIWIWIQVRPKAGEAKFGEWPHVCAILKKESISDVSIKLILYLSKSISTKIQIQEESLKIYQCGASLIDYGIVLTAAHCIADIRSVVLVF